MSRGELDLVAAIRAELAAIVPERRCCCRAELDALADSGRRADIAVAKTVHRLSAQLTVAEGRRDPGTMGAARQAHATAEQLAAPRAARHCRRAFLRGRLLARGSLSLASGRAHLELVVRPEEAVPLAPLLDRAGPGPSSRLRRGRVVFTWKGERAILAVLRGLGGGAALADLEARSIGREVRGSINRSVNAETANVRRTVAASMRQARAARRLLAAGSVDPASAIGAVAAARLAAPEASIGELAAQLHRSRAAIQRELQRIERAAGALDRPLA